MRNLKRALSLTLASVMLLGMMVVGAGAAERYPDVSDEDNVEAIEVLQRVAVMEGDNNGNFNPDDYVTREQMAVIMSKLLNLNYNYYQGTNPFSDVPAWAAPYVAACAANGITSGIGGGMYGAGQNVNAVQAALMMLKALGYFQYQEDFGDSYILATVKQATEVGLFSGIDSNANSALTRNEVAQMALNALKSDMVSFTGEVGIEIPNVGNVGYKAEYTPRTSTLSKYQAIERRSSDVSGDANHRGQYYIQLGEELYDGKLRLRDTIDVFGRPARNWEYDGKEIGTYAKYELMKAEYTKAVKGDTLYDLLTRNTVINYDLTVYIDGETEAPAGCTSTNWWFTKTQINRNNNATLGGTGNGVLTQVFVDDDDDTVTIAIINTYLAIATEDYNAKRDEAKFYVYGIDQATGNGPYFKEVLDGQVDREDMRTSNELFNVENIKKDDAVLVTVADKEFQSLVPAEIIGNTEIQSFSTGSNKGSNPNWSVSSPGNVVVEGTQYDFASAAEYDPSVMEYYTNSDNGVVNLKDKTYNVYLDKYGYAIGVKELEGSKNYVFITGIDLNGSNLGNKNADASAIFLDGTMDTIKVNMGKSEFQTLTNSHVDSVLNTWCTYTVNSNGIYTVKEVSHVNKNVNGTTPATDPENPDYTPSGDANRNSGKLAQYNMSVGAANNNADATVIKVDDKHVSVDGRDNTPGGDYRRVYGTDNTVYITVELAELKNQSHYGIINDVVSVTTGISNVSLEAWSVGVARTKAEDNKIGSTSDLTSENTLSIAGSPTTNTYNKSRTSNGVYSLYNDNGDIIAMIVVGEDAGTVKNLVYTHTSSVSREALNKETGNYTWTRKVINNGEEVELTEVDDGLSKLGAMDQYTWYQVRYNADGNVIDVKAAASVLTGGDTTSTDYVVDYKLIDDVLDKSSKESILYTSLSPEINSQNLKMPGRTLFLGTTEAEGLRIDTNVKIALIQKNNNAWDTHFDEGIDTLRGIVEDLNERHTNGKNHNYVISAIMERGVATSVVIYDASGICDPYTDPDWGNNTDSVRGNITVKANVINVKDIKTSITKNGELNIAIPAPAWATEGSVTLKVTVDGVPQTLKMGDGVVDGGYLVYTSTGLEIDESNVVVVEITGSGSWAAEVPAGSTVSGSVSGSSTPTQIKDVLDQLGNSKDEDGDPVKGELNVSGNVNLKDVEVPNNVEVKVPAGSSVTLGSDSIAPGASVSGDGDVVVAGNVDFANIHVGGTITVGAGGVVKTTDDAIVGPDGSGVDIILDGGTIANGTDIAGAVVVKSDLTITDSYGFSANEIDIEAGVTLSCDLGNVPAPVIILAEGAKWSCTIGDDVWVGEATQQVYIEHSGANGYVNGVQMSDSGIATAIIYAYQNSLLTKVN